MLWGWRKAQGYGVVSVLVEGGRDVLYGKATSVLKSDGARQLSMMNTQRAVVHGGAEVELLPVGSGVLVQDDVMSVHKSIGLGIQGAY